MPRRLVSIAMTAVVLLGATATMYLVTHRSDAPADDALAPGTTATLTTDTGEARVTVRSAAPGHTACEQVRPPARGVYLVADVTVDVVKGEWPVDSMDFTYFAPRPGASYTLVMAVGRLGEGCGSDLPKCSLHTGQKVSGTVFFGGDQPGGEIYYSPRNMRNGVSWHTG